MTLCKEKKLSTFGLPGSGVETRYFTRASDAIAQIRHARAKGFPIIPAGDGTNCAFLAAKIPAVFLRSDDKSLKAVKGGSTVRVTVGAGFNWDDLVRAAVKNDWSGIERLSGIPGTCGAAPVQNIGAYGASLSDVVASVRAVNLRTLQLVTLSSGDCHFGYRTSIFNTTRRGEFLITSMTLRLRKGGIAIVSDHAELRAILPAKPSLSQVRKLILVIRKRKLPDYMTLPNCGSFFKNPIVSKKVGDRLLSLFPDAPHWEEGKKNIKFSAAWLIDHSGVRDRHWGKIAISKKHALVLVNRGEKQHEQLRKAIQSISDAVRKKFGVVLEPEPNLFDEGYAKRALSAQGG
jgi:UDP-N-acetylmuramate dehydrogenase